MGCCSLSTAKCPSKSAKAICSSPKMASMAHSSSSVDPPELFQYVTRPIHCGRARYGSVLGPNDGTGAIASRRCPVSSDKTTHRDREADIAAYKMAARKALSTDHPLINKLEENLTFIGNYHGE